MTSILRYPVIVLYLLIEYHVQVKAHIFPFLVMFEKERIVEWKMKTVNKDNQRYLKIPLFLQQHILDALQVNNTACVHGPISLTLKTHEIIYSLILSSSCNCISINKPQKTNYITYLHLHIYHIWYLLHHSLLQGIELQLLIELR